MFWLSTFLPNTFTWVKTSWSVSAIVFSFKGTSRWIVGVFEQKMGQNGKVRGQGYGGQLLIADAAETSIASKFQPPVGVIKPPEVFSLTFLTQQFVWSVSCLTTGWRIVLWGRRRRSQQLPLLCPDLLLHVDSPWEAEPPRTLTASFPPSCRPFVSHWQWCVPDETRVQLSCCCCSRIMRHA